MRGSLATRNRPAEAPNIASTVRILRALSGDLIPNQDELDGERRDQREGREVMEKGKQGWHRNILSSCASRHALPCHYIPL